MLSPWRLHDLFEEFSQCFREADIALIAPVYAAGEDPIEGASHTALVESLVSHGHKNAHALATLEDLPAKIREIVQPGDMIVCLGAGDITTHANALADKLGG